MNDYIILRIGEKKHVYALDEVLDALRRQTNRTAKQEGSYWQLVRDNARLKKQIEAQQEAIAAYQEWFKEREHWVA